jgi:hypothetical protein
LLVLCRPRKSDESDIPSPKRLGNLSVSPHPISTPTPSPEPGISLSQEERQKIEQKRLQAESKLVAKRFGAEQIGLSWFKALSEEFKKSYMTQVHFRYILGTCTCGEKNESE